MLEPLNKINVGEKMTTSEKSTIPLWLEWEFLRDGYEIKNPTIELPLPGVPHLLKIWRDEEYKIGAEISGQPRSFVIDAEKKDDAGKVVHSSVISGTNDIGEAYEIIGYLSGDVNVQHNIIEGGGQDQGSFNASLTLNRVKIIQQQKDTPIEWLTEWYINGIASGHVLSRSTSRQWDETYIRERDILKCKKEQFDAGRRISMSRDYAFIQCDDFGFIISAVPDQCGPEWSNNIGIEYRREFGRLPSNEERVAISEIVSFVLGKHLLNVGFTSYDRAGIPIEKVAINPWGDNIRHVCQSVSLPPFELDRLAPTRKIETVLPLLIKKYLELRESLKLNEVLWRYWIGSELPLGSNIPIMANGIEILAKYWFKSQKSKSKGVYLAKVEYEKITSATFSKIAEELKEAPFKEKIINKLKDCFNMSLTDKLKFFFEEIGLPLGKSEEDAIRCRHKMIHSSVDMRDTELERVTRLSLAYQCLVHRTILKILGYAGTYTDYSAIGIPEKPIDVVAGGEEK